MTWEVLAVGFFLALAWARMWMPVRDRWQMTVAVLVECAFLGLTNHVRGDAVGLAYWVALAFWLGCLLVDLRARRRAPIEGAKGTHAWLEALLVEAERRHPTEDGCRHSLTLDEDGDLVLDLADQDFWCPIEVNDLGRPPAEVLEEFEEGMVGGDDEEPAEEAS